MAKSAQKPETESESQQLLEFHKRLLLDLQQIRDELVAPRTKRMASRFHSQTGSSPEGLGPITAAVEEALRAVKLSESAIRLEISQKHPEAEIHGIDNVPAVLGRFIAERSVNPGFQYEVVHDENRGWIVRWKEYWNGHVRGSGRFYERPYAWLDD